MLLPSLSTEPSGTKSDVWPNIIGAATLATDVFNTGADIWANNKNEALTREAWVRDDNAVQRRVADLKAAGINPMLAAGSASGVSNPIRAEPPRAEFNAPQNIAVMQNLMKMQADVSRTLAEKKLIEENTRSVALSTNWQEFQRQAEMEWLHSNAKNEANRKAFAAFKEKYAAEKEEVSKEREKLALEADQQFKSLGQGASIIGPFMQMFLKAMGGN